MRALLTHAVLATCLVVATPATAGVRAVREADGTVRFTNRRAGDGPRLQKVKEADGSTRLVLRSGVTCRPRPDRGQYDSLFDAAVVAHGVPLPLLKAVARAESGFDPQAVSRAGARGLMQLMPATAAALGVRDPFDPRQAIDGGARYLKQLRERFGEWSLALAAYNAGPETVARHGGVPPFEETQRYVERILQWYEEDLAASKRSDPT